VSRSLLVVEDDRGLGATIGRLFEREGWECQVAATLAEAREALDGSIIDVALVDLQLPDGTAFDLLPALKRAASEPSFIVVTGNRDPRVTVRALREGAFDYLVKPVELPELLAVVENAWSVSISRRSHERARRSAGLERLHGETPVMVAMREQIRRIARSTCETVLVLGETGTGKQLVAEAIHQESERAKRPLVQLNVAALPTSLVESELFGHERGAFTDARDPRRGLFEEADSGTLLLDEISELDLAVQPKLLRVLEERRVRRIGSSREVAVSVRVVAASNKDLGAQVVSGRFREDLYYRLDVARIEIPPLRSRLADILPLARHLLQELAPGGGRIPALTPDAERALLSHPWPGNVRELRNALERALFVAGGDWIGPDELQLRRRGETAAPTAPPRSLPGFSPGGPEIVPYDEMGARYAAWAVRRAGGNKTEAARRLGVSRTTLRKLLEQAAREGGRPGREADEEPRPAPAPETPART
jgi:two-component system, NtrC family, response regulator AtoC